MAAAAEFRDEEKKYDEENGMQPTTSHAVGTARRASISDAVFGEISEDGPNYRSVSSYLHNLPALKLTLIFRSDGKAPVC